MRFSLRYASAFLISVALLSVPISGMADFMDTEDPSFSVVFRDGLLTVKVKDVPVERVLKEIAKQAQIKILFYGQAEERLSVDFSGIPLDKGVKRLIADRDHAMIYGRSQADGAEPEIREIIIYPRSDESRAKSGGPTMIAPNQKALEEPQEDILASLFKALEDKDPMVREETVYLLSEFEDERVIEHLTSVLLKDEAEAVRASAAEELGDLGDQKAIDPLIKALSDDNALVRESVAMALGEIGGRSAIPRLTEALGDKDEDVRDAAAEALAEIEERLGVSESE